MTAPASPIRTIPLGASAAAAVVWRFRGALRATVVVKATFQIVPGGIMTPVPPEEIVTAEINHGNSPLRSARLTSDLAPFVLGGDVVLTGHAHAPAEKPVTSLQTRLVVFDDAALLVDKRVIVRGDMKDGQPQPFARMPLVYERAYGGIGYADNPLGVGADTSQRKAPNLVSPDGPEIVACYGPISRVMPVRRRLLKSLERSALDKPVAELPDDFDWTYFHVSPPGQRVSYLKGHERIVLEGMSPEHPRLTSSLPAAHAAARIHGLEGDPLPVPLVADTLRIDTDALTCTLVWRGSFPLPSEASIAAITVLAGVETATEPLHWPATLPAADTAPSLDNLPRDRPTEIRDFSKTSVVTEAPAAAALPFRPGIAGVPPPRVTTQTPPLSPRQTPEDRPSSRHTTTVDIAPPEESPYTLPFQRQVAPAPPPPPAVVELDSAEIEDVTFEFVREPDNLSASAPATTRVVAPLPVSPPRVPTQAPALAQALSPPAAHAPPLPVPATPPLPAAPTGLPPSPVYTAPRPAAPQGPALHHDPRFAVQLLPWGLVPSRDCLSVVAKTTCDLLPGAPAEPCPAPDPLSSERLFDTDRGPLTHYPSDRVPFKPRADILLVGHAHSPVGPAGPAATSEVVLRFGHPESSFERHILVFGDRLWERGKAGPVAGRPAPFTRIPLTHDRAFGGPAFDRNPAGRGHRPPLRLSHDLTLPNLEDPDKRLRLPTQKAEPASPGPLPEAWRARWARAGREAPVFGALGDHLDWTLFQAAPRAQQLPHLQGDEPFELTGVHPQHPKLTGSLPGLTLKAEITWKPATPAAGPAAPAPRTEVPLVLDTVVLDTDAMKVHLVYRAVLPVADEKDPGITSVKLLVDKLA